MIRENGFTLIELIVVVLIIGILAALYLGRQAQRRLFAVQLLGLHDEPAGDDHSLQRSAVPNVLKRREEVMSRTRQGGQTLIEVVIASLLLAMMTVPIMAAAFGGRKLTARTTRRLQAAAYTRNAAEALKAYAVADLTIVAGPGPGPNNGWSLSGDASGNYALDAGHHDLAPAEWLAELAASPYNGTISYDVTVRQTPQGPQPDVAFNIQWTDQ